MWYSQCVPSDETSSPSDVPSEIPTKSLTTSPTESPTQLPSSVPSEIPSESPTTSPSEWPTQSPSGVPSGIPSESPSKSPSKAPTLVPTCACDLSTSSTTGGGLSVFPEPSDTSRSCSIFNFDFGVGYHEGTLDIPLDSIFVFPPRTVFQIQFHPNSAGNYHLRETSGVVQDSITGSVTGYDGGFLLINRFSWPQLAPSLGTNCGTTGKAGNSFLSYNEAFTGTCKVNVVQLPFRTDPGTPIVVPDDVQQTPVTVPMANWTPSFYTFNMPSEENLESFQLNVPNFGFYQLTRTDAFATNISPLQFRLCQHIRTSLMLTNL